MTKTNPIRLKHTQPIRLKDVHKIDLVLNYSYEGTVICGKIELPVRSTTLVCSCGWHGAHWSISKYSDPKQDSESTRVERILHLLEEFEVG